MRRKVNWTAAVVGCSIAFGSCAAEQIFYRSVLSNGRIVYGDAPATGAKRTEKITVRSDTPSSEIDAAAAQRSLDMTRQQLLQDAAARSARLTQLETEIAAAYNQLKVSKEAREAGRDIQEGDRQGRRLLAPYWERQRSLETEVRQAQQRLDKLLAERAGLM
jgi:hypothetical protein